MEFVSWDDEIPNLCKVIKFMFQTTNQIWDLYGISVGFIYDFNGIEWDLLKFTVYGIFMLDMSMRYLNILILVWD
jgi:hypothetical protein